MFENVDRRTTEGRMDGNRSDWYTISSPMSQGSGEIKIYLNLHNFTILTFKSNPRGQGCV